MNMKTALLIVGEGYGNIVWTTPVSVALHKLGYGVDVLVDSHWKDAWMVYHKSKYIREVYSDSIGIEPKSYEIILRTRWGKTQYSNEIKFKHLDYSKHHEAEANFTVMESLGYNGIIPECYFADVRWNNMPKMIKTIAIADPKVNQQIWDRRKYPFIDELITALIYCGHNVITVGSEADFQEWRNKGYVYEGICESDIYEAAKKMAQCDLFIGQDCGLTQIAAAIRMPTIALFGPTRLSKNRPLGQRVKVIQSEEKCAPCQLLPTFGECKDFKCMRSITVEQIVKVVQEMFDVYG